MLNVSNKSQSDKLWDELRNIQQVAGWDTRNYTVEQAHRAQELTEAMTALFVKPAQVEQKLLEESSSVSDMSSDLSLLSLERSNGVSKRSFGCSSEGSQKGAIPAMVGAVGGDSMQAAVISTEVEGRPLRYGGSFTSDTVGPSLSTPPSRVSSSVEQKQTTPLIPIQVVNRRPKLAYVGGINGNPEAGSLVQFWRLAQMNENGIRLSQCCHCGNACRQRWRMLLVMC